MIEDIHSLDVPAFIFDPENYFFIDANGLFIGLYGFTLEELIKMRIFQLRPPEELHQALSTMESTKGNVIYSGDSNHQKKNGERFRVQVFGKRFLLHNKELFQAKVIVKEKN